MIGIVLLIAVLICVSSIFFPGLRKLAAAILTTALVVVGGFFALIALFHH